MSIVRFLVASKDLAGQQMASLNPRDVLKGILSQNPNVTFKKEIPLVEGHLVEIDSMHVNAFQQQMKNLGITATADDLSYSIPMPIEIRFPGWPHDPRTNHLMRPQDRIDATREVLTQFDPHWFERGIAGKGVTVCVIDTGVYPDPEIKSRLVGFDDLVNGRSGVANAYDDDGHGTHCCGLIAADGSTTGGGFKGVAPEANLYVIKVLNREGAGSLSDIISGIQLAIQNKDKYGIRVISMSLGGPANLKEKDDLIALAIDKAYDAGIVPVIAAGNSGPGMMTIGSPAISDHAITVGAWDDKNTPALSDDSVTWWSSRGPTLRDHLDKPDICGLGNQMVSLRSPGSYLDSLVPHYDSHHVLMSGTSMATPWDAGGIADIISANPSLTVPQVFEIVKKSGSVLPNESKWLQGAGLLNVPRGCDLAVAYNLSAASA